MATATLVEGPGTRTNGAIPSPDDARDHAAELVYRVAAAAPPRFPATLGMRPWCRAVRDQGSSSTCAAQTAACIKEYQELQDTGVRSDFSVRFVYQRRENAPAKGMYGRDVMRILLKLGDAPKDQETRDDVVDCAAPYRIAEYARVHTVDGLKQALAADGPCYISFPVYNHGTRMWKPEPGDEQTGGHAMAVVGYTRRGFLIRNSWGEDWGDKGHCVYPYEDFGSHWEIWTTVDKTGSHAPPRPRRGCTGCTLL